MRTLSGEVTFNIDRIPGVTIKNLNLHIQAISNEIGQFSIKVKSGDTLLSVKDGYIKDTLVMDSQQFILIHLRKRLISLNEVVVKSTFISPLEIYENNKKDYKLIYFNGDNKGIFFSGSLVNIDKLNNALGKKGIEARQLQHELTKDYKNRIVDSKFNPIAANVTGYKGKQLDDFISANRPSYETIINFTDYDIIQYVRKKLRERKGK